MSLHRASPFLLAGLLAGSGVLHFLVPRPYEGIVPSALGNPLPWVYASGVAELGCAAGVAWPRTRRAAAWASAALFLAVFPANVQMAVDWSHRSLADRALAYGRLPLQVPLVVWAVSVARAAHRRESAGRRYRSALQHHGPGALPGPRP